MVEQKLFKTRLCASYGRGKCSRDNCPFAHGDAELRRFSASNSNSFNGRRDHRGDDLRDKLERRRSPQRRYSPERDVRGRHAPRSQKYERGFSGSVSPSRSDKRPTKKPHLDVHSDLPASLKVAESSDGFRDRKLMSSSAQDELKEKLKKSQLDVDKLEDHKTQLEIRLENKVHEADTLIFRIEELETQLSKEQEDYKRMTSTIKKFVKVHSRFSKAQEELKRSQSRLQKMGDQLVDDASKYKPNDEDLAFNNVIDGHPNNENGIGPRYGPQNHPSSSKKRPRISREASEEMKAGNHNRSQLRSNGPRSLAYEDNNNARRKSSSHSDDPIPKVKGWEPGLPLPPPPPLPPTCMTTQINDELFEVVTMENTEEVGPASTVVERRSPRERTRLPPPPPLPSLRKNAYKEFEDDDRDVEVDVEELDMVGHDSDNNNDVDIEQV
ncbi:hypothetical protein ACHQM5_003732 [Ranunculus cassubicifolius]